MVPTRKQTQMKTRRRRESGWMLSSTTVVAISAAAVLANAATTAAFVGTHHPLTPSTLSSSSPLPTITRKSVQMSMDTNSEYESTATKKPLTLTTLKNEIPRYIRIQPRTYRGNRRKFELQTAVTTFENIKNGVTVDLHAQVHFGDPSYFNMYNNDDVFASHYDRVHYELVVDESMLKSVDSSRDESMRRLIPMKDGKNPIMPSARDAQTASQYGLKCQVDMIHYGSSDKWIHADFTREEFLRETSKPAASTRSSSNANVLMNDENVIFSLASTAATTLTSLPGAEVFTALFRPATPSTPVTSRVTRRLFSNLFLPGDALTSAMRALLWTAVPCPEVSVLLLDWSSLLPRPGGGISPVAIPVLECLLTGNVMEARRLVFSQMVVSGQSAEENSDRAENVIVGQRNARALEVLNKSIEEDGCRKNALLYGGMHCRDLHRRLRDAGFVPKQTVWRTAWSVDVPSFGTGGGKNGRGITAPVTQPAVFAASSSPAAIAVGLVAVPLYLAVGGLDWIATVRDVSGTFENGQVFDGVLEIILYLIRHVALYLGLAKFVVEWDEVDLFGGADD